MRAAGSITAAIRSARVMHPMLPLIVEVETLEQLEAAFYTQVVTNGSFTTNFNALEQEYIKDVRDHEVAHREFFKAALGSNAIQSLEVNFSSIDFGNRNSVLTTAVSNPNVLIRVRESVRPGGTPGFASRHSSNWAVPHCSSATPNRTTSGESQKKFISASTSPAASACS